MGRRAAAGNRAGAGRRPKMGDVAARLRESAAARGPGTAADQAAVRRELLAAWCKMALPAHGMSGGAAGARHPAVEADAPAVAPRARETLRHLLAGDSEKQIAMKLGISPHTVHVYVKRLYRHYGVSSRGELFARFVRRAGGADGDIP